MSGAQALPASTSVDPVLTADQLRMALPKSYKNNITDDLVDLMNNVTNDVNFRENYRQNMLTFTGVLKESKYKLQGYIDGVKFVTFKSMGMSDYSAWCAVFPDRYMHYVSKNTDEKHIASVVSMYRRGSLVNTIIEQTVVPMHILYADTRHKAINRLAYLMDNAKSEFVQSTSAGKLLDMLKLPETTKIELDVKINEDQSINELRQTTLELVAQQKLALKSGSMSPKQVAESKLVVIEGESEEIG